MQLFKLFADIVVRKYDLTRRMTLNVRSAVADDTGNEKYKLNNEWRFVSILLLTFVTSQIVETMVTLFSLHDVSWLYNFTYAGNSFNSSHKQFKSRIFLKLSSSSVKSASKQLLALFTKANL